MNEEMKKMNRKRILKLLELDRFSEINELIFFFILIC